jgi:hypothetical protein
VAQLGARLNRTQEVRGSNPLSSTKAVCAGSRGPSTYVGGLCVPHRASSHGRRRWDTVASRERRETEEAIILKPADYLLLGAAFLSFLFSIYLWFSGQRDEGVFVGIWVPSILAFGGYMRSAFRKG